MQINQRKAGILLNYANEGVKIITALVYTPWMLRLLGQSEYGLYQLVSSTVAYLSLLSLGFSSAYVRFFSGYDVKKDHTGIKQLNGMFMVVFCAMALVCCACGGVMTACVDSIFGSGLTAAELSKARVLMVILVASMAISFPKSVFVCYLTAHEKFLFLKLLNLVSSILNPFLTLPLLLLGFDSVAVVTVTAGLMVVTLAADMWFCFSKLQMEFTLKGLRFSLLGEVAAFTFFIFLNQIIDQVNWSVDKFLLGRMAGTAAVAVYGVGGQINSLYLHMSSSISGVFVPKVNRIVAETNDNRELTQLMVKVGRVQFFVISLVLTGFAFFGRPFVHLWAGDEYADAYWVALLLMGSTVVPMIQSIGIEIQRAKNLHQARSVVYTCLAAGNVLLSVVLIRRWGCVGAATGTAVAMILGTGFFMNWYYHRKIGLDMRLFWKGISGLFGALLPVCLFGGILCYFAPVKTWGGLALSVAVYTAAFLLVMWRFGMNTYEKQLLQKMLCKIPGAQKTPKSLR